ncbi:MAG: hypothetical protein N3D16_11410 [Anaerolineales bacterium]|nr:hypothetical protein [Anaerolineales bacterium]
MIRKRAILPLNTKAAKAAENEFCAQHSKQAVNGQQGTIPGPNYFTQDELRQAWIEAYERHGGKVERLSGIHIRQAKEAAQQQASEKPVGSAIILCPRAEQTALSMGREPNSSLNASLSIKGGIDEGLPTQSSFSDKQNSVCTLSEVDIYCMHGRQPGPARILMVVPSLNAPGDMIRCNLKIKGECNKHPVWSVGGMRTSKSRGTHFEFLAETWVPPNCLPSTIKSLLPQIYRVEGRACTGGPQVYEIRVYPTGKIGTKVNVQKVSEQILDFLKNLPIPKQELSKGSLQWFQGSIEYEGIWKEDKDWQVFYQESRSGGFDPLCKLDYKGPIDPPTQVPDFLAQWTGPGLFYEVKWGVKLQCSIRSKYWPCNNKEELSEYRVSGENTTENSLFIELKLASSALVEAAIAGENKISIEASNQKSDTAKIELNFKFSSFKGETILKTIWGWVEFKREFQVFKEYERSYTWLLDQTE